jgi:hypothetical protein
VVGVDVGAVEPLFARVGQNGHGDVRERRGEKHSEEDAAAQAGVKEPERGDEDGGVSEGQKAHRDRLGRVDGEARERYGKTSRARKKRERSAGAAVDFQSDRRQRMDDAVREGEKLKTREKRETDGRSHGGPYQGGQAGLGDPGRFEEREGRCQEGQNLELECSPGEDASVGNGRRGDEKQQKKEAGRAKVSGKSRLHFGYGFGFGLGFLFGVSFILRVSAAGIDPFTAARLTAGKEAYRAARFQEAVDELRIGCFGLLEQPPLLLECTARLALAQKAAGRAASVDETLRRFNEIESRFGVWKEVGLEPPLRADFVKLVKERKGFDGLFAAISAPAVPATPAVPSAPTATPTPVITPNPTPLPQPKKGPTVADVQKLLQEKSFDQAHVASLAILDREPRSREIQKLVLETAVLSKNFEMGARQVSKLEPFRDGEEGPMFYASVALFETGSVEKARRLVEKALAKLASNPYVDYYKMKILD